MFKLRKMHGRISVKTPDGERLHFMSISAALEFVRLATLMETYGV